MGCKKNDYRSYSELPASLKVADVAQALNVSIAQAYIVVNRDDFPKIRLGGTRIVVPKDSFLAWLQSHLSNNAHTLEPKESPEKQLAKQQLIEQIVAQQQLLHQILVQQQNLQQLLIKQM